MGARMTDEIDIEFEALWAELEKVWEKKKLRRERPWVFDIIRVLWGHQSSQGMRIAVLCREVWHIRQPSGLNMPKSFTETVQSCLNQHTSQSSVWAKNGSRAEDDIFYSPQGKGSGTWAVHRDRASAWLRRRELPEV